MALFKDKKFLAQKIDDGFDADYEPGERTPASGIYRCISCGEEVASEQGSPLPGRSHHQHSQAREQIRWRMVVEAERAPRHAA
jgi:hypothetical protein